jgi:glycosyltransferase involved in cell wall biosynthesis
MQAPFFSVILPTYNRAHLIERAILSVTGQTFKDWELIIVDDGSTDNTAETVAKFTDTRIKYVYQTNQERSAARNTGIKSSTGKFVCFIDSDDFWYPNHLETLEQKIVEQKEKIALYYTAMRWKFTDHAEDVIFERPEGKNPVEYVIANQIAPSSACLHAQITQNIKFNTALTINEDVEFFARIVNEYDLIQIPVITIDLNIHGENTKGTFKDFISPQIRAMQTIFENPALKGKISGAFKRRIFRSLYHQLIIACNDLGNYSKMNQTIIRFVLLYPFDPTNKSKVVLLLYHLPGGGMLKSLVRKVKAL